MTWKKLNALDVGLKEIGRLATRTCKCHYHDNGGWGVVNNWNAACVGSGTVTYGAMGWRFMEVDFRLRSHYGEVADSSLADWPIPYDDLEPYYYQAECEVGVCGDNGDNPFSSPRKQPFPMPPFDLDPESKLMWDVTKKMGLHPFHVPFLRNSVPYNGRPACIHQHACVGFPCPIDAKNGTQNTVIPVALKSGNCELRLRAMVTELMVDDAGRLSGVRSVDGRDVLHELAAKVVVLAAGSAFAVSEATSDASFLYVKTAESSFWRTATNNVVSIPVEYPAGVESATLSVSGAGYSKIYEDVPEGMFNLTLRFLK